MKKVKKCKTTLKKLRKINKKLNFSETGLFTLKKVKRVIKIYVNFFLFILLKPNHCCFYMPSNVTIDFFKQELYIQT